jgi:hypothetical protein
LAQDWQIGVWDRTADRLLHLFDCPRGLVADNAALTFSPDVRRFAAAAGERAVVWDLETGEELRAWKLPKGFQDNLAFHGEQLLSIRVETPDERTPPYGTDPRKYPRICRVRNLLGPDPRAVIRELREFNLHVFHSAVSNDGRHLVVEGLGGPPGAQPERIARLYDAPTGRLIARIPTTLPPTVDNAFFRFDPSGSALVHRHTENGLGHLLSIPDLAYLGDLDGHPFWCQDRKLIKWYAFTNQDGATVPPAHSVRDNLREAPLVTIASSALPSTTYSEFSRDGRFVTWGSADATVSVCDLFEVQRRLAEIGLGW